MTRDTTNQINELARLGATARLVEIEEEVRAIRSTLNAISDSNGSAHLPAPAPARLPNGKQLTRPAVSGPAPSAPAKRRRMSKQARARISARMKQYWASQRAAARKTR